MWHLTFAARIIIIIYIPAIVGPVTALEGKTPEDKHVTFPPPVPRSDCGALLISLQQCRVGGARQTEEFLQRAVGIHRLSMGFRLSNLPWS